MLHVIFVIYIFSLCLGVIAPQRWNRFLFEIGLVMVVLSFVLIYVLSTVFTGYAVLVLAGFSWVFFFPLASSGFGLSAGAFAKKKFLNGASTFAYCAGALAVLVPSLTFSAFLYNLEMKRLDKAKRLAEFQAGSIHGILGGTNVVIPASPQFKTKHECSAPFFNCYTYFWRSGEQLQEYVKSKDLIAIFKEVTVNPIHDTCVGETAPLTIV